jgi:hypothetical protein
MLSWFREFVRPKVYQFLHIPKTAGTSLNHLLAARFRPDQVCPVHLWSQLLELPREKLDEYRLFHGHFYYYLRDYLQRPLVTFTFLRDPFERSLSHYEHVLRDPAHYFHAKAKAQGSLKAFLADPETRPMIANFQTRSLALDLDPRAVKSRLPAGVPVERELESVMPAESDHDRLLERASARLRQMAFVGVVKYFDESVRRLFAQLGWELPTSIPTMNVSSNRTNRGALSGEEKRLLEKNLELDLELYARATRYFNERHGLHAA